MQIRTTTDRIFQSILYQLTGTALATPAYHWLFGATAAESALLMTAVSVVELGWFSVHNMLFDMWEHRRTRRVASDRPHSWRVLHAFSHEASSVVVTLPAIMWVGGHPFWEALMIDVGLTLFYTAFAYVFYLAYDWLWPVKQTGRKRGRLPAQGIVQGQVPTPAAYAAATGAGGAFPQAGFHLHAVLDGHGAPPAVLEDHAVVFHTLFKLAGIMGRPMLAETQLLRIAPREALTSGGLTAMLAHVEGEVLLHTFPEAPMHRG